MQRIVDPLLTLDAVALWKISWDEADIISYKSGAWSPKGNHGYTLATY